jgi:SpoVK/Ycf46/Vps4 family AAA+-type ATPase
MINFFTNRIDECIQQNSFLEKVVLSRITVIALSCLTPLEAAFRVGETAFCWTAYLISSPFATAINLANLINKVITLKEYDEKQYNFFNDWVLKTAQKTLFTAYSIFFIPLVGLIDPHIMVTMNYTFGTAIKDAKKVKAQVEKRSEYDHFVGEQELLKIYDRYITYLKDPEGAKDYGVQLPSGLLLYGPTGCGKTFAANYLSFYAKKKGVELKMIRISISQLSSQWFGESEKLVKKMFDDAIAAQKRAQIPHVIFIDELEGLVPSRQTIMTTGMQETIIKQIGEFLQGLEKMKHHRIIVIGATNHPEKIDWAILRSGRFDFKYAVNAPDENTRNQMIQSKLNFRTKKVDEINYSDLKEITKDFNASDIDTMINNACFDAFEKKCIISTQILLAAAKPISDQKAALLSQTTTLRTQQQLAQLLAASKK